MRILGWGGVAMAGVGALMLVAPGLARLLLRVGLGVQFTTHPAGRVAAWGLVWLGLAIVILARAVA